MKKSILIWNDIFSEDRLLKRLESYLDEGCKLEEFPTEADPYDDYQYVEAMYGNGFMIRNHSKFRNECKYTTIALTDGYWFDDRFVGIKIEYECPDDEYMIRVLEYGENFFYKKVET